MRVLTIAVLLLVPISLQAEPDDAQVARLVAQLDADERSTREAAEKELLKLGPAVLDKLPPFDDPNLSAEQRQRLRRLVPALWDARLAQDVAGSKVELSKANLPLVQAMEEISKQSGNPIADMRAELDQPITNPEVHLDEAPTLFWKAADEILQQSGTSFYFHAQDRKLGILGRPQRRGPVAYAGALRIEATRLVLERFLADTEQPSSCVIQLEGLVEPRLEPLLFEIDTTKLTARDDKGNQLAFLGPEAFPVMIDLSSFQFPLQLRLDVPPREATAIAEIAGELTVCLPAHVETVRFDASKEGEVTTPSLRVKLGAVTDEEGIWTYPVEVEYLISKVVVDSYLEASLKIEIHLEDKKSNRVEQNGGMNVQSSDDGNYRAEFLFVDIPGKPADYHAVLEIPSGITRVPISFSLKDLPLP